MHVHIYYDAYHYTNILVKASGYSEEDATTVAEILMYAELRGNNQGNVENIIRVHLNSL